MKPSRLFNLALAFAIAEAAIGASIVSCGGGGDDATAKTSSSGAGGSQGSGGSGQGGGDLFPDAGGDSQSAIAIEPANPVVDVSIVDGVVTTKPLALTAVGPGGVTVSASWSFDRGELGGIDASTGVFTASGTLGGKGKVTAQVGALSATTALTVKLHVTQNGGPAGSDAGVVDGGGGVGGEGPGGPVDPATQTLLLGAAQAPADASELGWLYPYDRTVWPRGLLPPLLQWQTTHAVSAVYIHLTQQDYEFEGFYAGANLLRQPLDTTGWRQATSGNEGDTLHVEIKALDANTVYGPIAEAWTVAPGVLKGTVYYTEYSNSNPRFGAEMAIKPGASAPTYATPDMSCHACHEVSANGSTLFATIGDTTDGASYDLTQNGQLIATYTGTAADSTSNAYKFTWSAPYPDGTFAVASSRHPIGPPGDDNYTGDSQLFRRSDGTAIATTGFAPGVTAAAMPAFSPDGKRLAFNFWEGMPTNGVAPGAGHNLAVMDFSCGAVDGGVGCGNPPYTFSNVRELFSDAQNYPGWPAFLPDQSGVIFNVTPDATLCTGTGCGAAVMPPSEVWWVDVPPDAQTKTQPTRLDGLDGIANGQSYLPTNAQHPDDTALSYKPTVVPIAVGGYSWVVFMSRRMYGNAAAGDPFARADNVVPCLAKLWVAAVDLNPKPGTDPSHPAFYLPGQDFMHANIHGFWAPDPCQSNGAACVSGDECCGGYCRAVDGGFVCTDQIQGCSQEFEKCTSSGDCCTGDFAAVCINGHCAHPPPK